MTDFEKRIENRLIEDKYAEKFHQLDIEKTIAHIYKDNNKLCEINEKRVQLELEMELEKKNDRIQIKNWRTLNYDEQKQ